MRMPDQTSVVHDERRAGVVLAHLLGHLAERVLRCDEEHVQGHQLADRVALVFEHRERKSRRLRFRRSAATSSSISITSAGGVASGGGSSSGEPGKERCEVAAGTFVGGHQRGSGLCVSTLPVPVSSRRGSADGRRSEETPQHRPERMCRTSAPELGGDRLGRSVGELGGDAALLDREGGDVPGGVDVVDAADAAVRVDRDKAIDGLRQAVDAWAAQSRQGDNAVDVETAFRDEP